MNYIKISTTITLVIALFFFSKWVDQSWPRFRTEKIITPCFCDDTTINGSKCSAKVNPDGHLDFDWSVKGTTYNDGDAIGYYQCYAEKKVRIN